MPVTATRIFTCITAPPPPTAEMLKCARKAVTESPLLCSKPILFKGKKYNVSVQHGCCLSVNRQDKSWYSSAGDFFVRGFTRGQRACYPRALQLEKAFHLALSEYSAAIQARPLPVLPEEHSKELSTSPQFRPPVPPEEDSKEPSTPPQSRPPLPPEEDSEGLSASPQSRPPVTPRKNLKGTSTPPQSRPPVTPRKNLKGTSTPPQFRPLVAPRKNLKGTSTPPQFRPPVAPRKNLRGTSTLPQLRPRVLSQKGLRNEPVSGRSLTRDLTKPAAVKLWKLALGQVADEKTQVQKFIELKFRLDEINQSIERENSLAGSWLSPELGRFKNIKALSETAVGNNLHANKIWVDKKPVAIACQYPKEAQIKDHLRMLADNRTPCLVVLSGDNEIINKSLPPYFRGDDALPAKLVEKEVPVSSNLKKPVKTESRTQAGTSESVRLLSDRYELTAADSKGTDVTIPVIHIKNWPDFNTVPQGELDGLVEKMGSVMAEAKNSSGASGLPVIHCRAGVGRTGLLIAQYVMSQDSAKEMSLEKIIKDMRASRNTSMVQSDDQIKTLVKECILNKRAVTEDETPEAVLNKS